MSKWMVFDVNSKFRFPSFFKTKEEAIAYYEKDCMKLNKSDKWKAANYMLVELHGNFNTEIVDETEETELIAWRYKEAE